MWTETYILPRSCPKQYLVCESFKHVHLWFLPFRSPEHFPVAFVVYPLRTRTIYFSFLQLPYDTCRSVDKYQYRKSFIKPLGLFISSTFDGGGGAYFIFIDSPRRTWTQSGKAQTNEVRSHAVEDQQIYLNFVHINSPYPINPHEGREGWGRSGSRGCTGSHIGNSWSRRTTVNRKRINFWRSGVQKFDLQNRERLI